MSTNKNLLIDVNAFSINQAPDQITYLLDRKLPKDILGKNKKFVSNKRKENAFIPAILVTVYILLIAGRYLQKEPGQNSYLQNEFNRGSILGEIKVVENKPKEKLKIFQDPALADSRSNTSLFTNKVIRNKNESFSNTLEGESMLNKMGFPVFSRIHNRNFRSSSIDRVMKYN